MNLLLIGCGNIGSALLNLWARLPVLDRIVVVQPSMTHASHFSHHPTIKFVPSMAAIAPDFVEDLTVLAIKPQTINKVIPDLQQRPCQSIIISLLAGTLLAQLSAWLPNSAKIIRLMPNMAIKTGNSINIAFSSSTLSTSDLDNITSAFAPSGDLTWVSEEKHLDSLTPISGSGPAYFFLLAEVLVTETIKLGINEEIARKLVQQLLIGSASLVEDNIHYGALIDSVASKKGVTQAALQVMRPSIKQTMEEALQAAFTRLRELSDENCR